MIEWICDLSRLRWKSLRFTKNVADIDGRENWKKAQFSSAFSHLCSMRLIVGSYYMTLFRWRSLPSFRSKFGGVGVKSGTFLSPTTSFNSKLTSQLTYFLQFLALTDFEEAPFGVRYAPTPHFLRSDRFSLRYRLIFSSFLVSSLFSERFDVVFSIMYCFW